MVRVHIDSIMSSWWETFSLLDARIASTHDPGHEGTRYYTSIAASSAQLLMPIACMDHVCDTCAFATLRPKALKRYTFASAHLRSHRITHRPKALNTFLWEWLPRTDAFVYVRLRLLCDWVPTHVRALGRSQPFP